MKIIAVDNYCRDEISDILICENVRNKWYGEFIVNKLNHCTNNEWYYKLVNDDYKLYEYEI